MGAFFESVDARCPESLVDPVGWWIFKEQPYHDLDMENAKISVWMRSEWGYLYQLRTRCKRCGSEWGRFGLTQTQLLNAGVRSAQIMALHDMSDPGLLDG